MNRPTVKIKKIPAYPIRTQMVGGGANCFIDIVKLTNRGFLAETHKQVVKVAEEFQVFFELPLLKNTIQSRVRVVKVYDQYRGHQSSAEAPSQVADAAATEDKKAAIYRMAEFHFLNLDAVMEQQILRFVKQLSRN